MLQNRPYTRVIKDKDKVVFKKDKTSSVRTEVKEIEEKMKFLFYHQPCTKANTVEYNILEAKWKSLTNQFLNP